MIFDSLGLGELGVIFVLVVILVEPKQLGKLMKGLGRFRRKVTQIQNEVRSQLNVLVAEDEARESREKAGADKASMRKWGRDRAAALPAAQRDEAAQAMVKTLGEWPGYRDAKVVSCFVGTLEEVDTAPLLRRILADGKTLLVPYVADNLMGMAPITDPDKDLREGAYQILEPVPEARGHEAPGPDLVLVPGTCFDVQGGRLGRGLGYYDRYLAGVKALKVGLCFDVQISEKNLALDSHDQRMDILVSEKRLLAISSPQGALIP